jgi:hypothetical protein
MNQLSRQCANLNISQPYRPPRPLTGIAFTSFLFSVCAVPVTGEHVRVSVCSHQRWWYVRHVLHHVVQITDALVLQPHLPLLFHLAVHLRHNQLIHFCHNGCLWHYKGKSKIWSRKNAFCMSVLRKSVIWKVTASKSVKQSNRTALWLLEKTLSVYIMRFCTQGFRYFSGKLFII